MPDTPGQRLRPGEYAEMLEAVAKFFMSWAFLENKMALLLLRLISQEKIGPAIYFTPTNIETRFKIVDTAFVLSAEAIPERDRATILAAWNTTMNTLNRIKATRNAIAHGSVEVGMLGGRRAMVRLIPPMLDARRQAPRKGQPLGMGASEIKQSTKAIDSAAHQIHDFRVLLESAGNDAAFQQKLAELTAHPPTSRPRSDGQRKPKQRRPPNSSQV